jgi:hypothetical protein
MSESRIMEDHLRIRALLDGLNAIADPNVLVTLLRDLRQTLDNHFALEEGDEGLHSMVALLDPDRAGNVDELLSQHRQLMALVDDLIRECNECIAGPLKGIRRNVNTLYTTIQNHDAAESELLTELLLKALQKESR